MDDGSGSVSADGNEPDRWGDRPIDRLLEDLVLTMTAMEDGRQPATTLDPFATPLAARRIQSLVLTERAERRRRNERRPRTVPAIVRTSAAFHPTAGVTEGVVLVREERHTRAYCVRLERYGTDWRVVELAPPDTSLRPVVTRASREGRISTTTADPYGPSRRDDEDGDDAEGREDGLTPV